ncbi:MAG: dihydroorotase, partial [bacterium]
FDDAAFGISCLETALASLTTLISRGELDLPSTIRALTSGPAGVFRFPAGIGTLSPGARDITVFDPSHRWTVEPRAFASKGRNTPLAGQELTGAVRAVIFDGLLAFELEAAGA